MGKNARVLISMSVREVRKIACATLHFWCCGVIGFNGIDKNRVLLGFVVGGTFVSVGKYLMRQLVKIDIVFVHILHF